MERKGKRTGVLGKIMAGIALAFHAVAKQAKNAAPTTTAPERYTARKPRRFKREMKGRFGGSTAFRGPAHLQRKLDRNAVENAIAHWNREQEAIQKIREDRKRQLGKMTADAIIADSERRFPSKAAQS
jgi:hypothetical protein